MIREWMTDYIYSHKNQLLTSLVFTSHWWSTTQPGFATLNAWHAPFKLSAVTYLRRSRLFHYFSSNEPEAQLT
jgi:hypothetical protein